MIYCILGQTASGKTSIAISLAKKYHLPVISADAFQCFKMMQIGTDKPKAEEIEGLDFYFTDEYEPDHEMSVYLFQQECRPILERYLQKGKDILVVGGNFLYVKALLFNYVFEDESQEENPYLAMSLEEMQKLLKEKSESTYAAIDIQNPRRVIRALTLLDHGKERADILKENDGKPLYPVEFLKVKIDKEVGNKKIDDRIDKMFEEGFVSEVESLLKKYPSTLRPFHCIGYDEILRAMEEGRKIDDSVKEEIKIHTHQYAKKQRTFLKHQFEGVKEGTKEEILSYLEEKLNQKGEKDYA